MSSIAFTVDSEVPLSAARTLRPHRRGPGDPTFVANGSEVWRASTMHSGIVTYRVVQHDRHRVDIDAWGPGAAELRDRAPALVGALDSADGFEPEHPLLREAHRRFPHLRVGRTGLVMESLVPAILEQKVHGIAAFASWRYLVRKFGAPAPGPVPRPMFAPPVADVWRRVPSWEFHRANVEPARSKAIVLAARMASKLEQAADLPIDAAHARLRMVPGVGVWTAAEVAQRALGDTDALSVGDYHLASVIGWTLTGRPMDDQQMVEYMEPLRPHRYRAVRLLEVSGTAMRPKFGPRTQVTDHRHH